jgi:hypothetical protein
MTLALDHAVVCTAVGAWEAEALTTAGFTEGSGNVHPGQGTACRRCCCEDAYLALLSVHDEAAARAAATAPTRLWARWRGRGEGHPCPFGVGRRATADAAVPVPRWPDRPRYLLPGAAMPVATNGDALHEAMLVVLPPRPRPTRKPGGSVVAAIAGGRSRASTRSGVREGTHVALAGPPAPPSAALAAVVAADVVERHAGDRLLIGSVGDGLG